MSPLPRAQARTAFAGLKIGRKFHRDHVADLKRGHRFRLLASRPEKVFDGEPLPIGSSALRLVTTASCRLHNAKSRGRRQMFTRPGYRGGAGILSCTGVFGSRKGYLRSIARLKSAYIRPTRAGPITTSVSPVYLHGGPLRKAIK